MDETKPAMPKKFIAGMIAITVSLVLGKVALIPIFLSDAWLLGIMIYITSWFIMVWGIYLAGMEGYRLIKFKYKEYKSRTTQKIKDKSKKAAEKTADALKKLRKHNTQDLNNENCKPTIFNKEGQS